MTHSYKNFTPVIRVDICFYVGDNEMLLTIYLMWSHPARENWIENHGDDR